MIISSGYSENHSRKSGEKMSNFQAGYALVGFFCFVLGIIFFFIDGMLLWSIGFIVIAITFILLKVMWGIATWADNVTRKFDGS
jgi:hypothetical protein